MTNENVSNWLIEAINELDRAEKRTTLKYKDYHIKKSREYLSKIAEYYNIN